MNNLEYFKKSFVSNDATDFIIEIPNGNKIFCCKFLLRANEYFSTYFNSDVGGEKNIMKFKLDDTVDNLIKSEHIEEIILKIYIPESTISDISQFGIKDLYIIIRIMHMWLTDYSIIFKYISLCSKILTNKFVSDDIDKEFLFEIINIGNILLSNEKNPDIKIVDLKKIGSYFSEHIDFISERMNYIKENNIVKMFDEVIIAYDLIKNNKTEDFHILSNPENYIDLAIQKYNLHEYSPLTKIISKINEYVCNKYYFHAKFVSYSQLTYYFIKSCATIMTDTCPNYSDFYYDMKSKSTKNKSLSFFPRCKIVVGDEILIRIRGLNDYIRDYIIFFKIISIKKGNREYAFIKKNLVVCDLEFVDYFDFSCTTIYDKYKMPCYSMLYNTIYIKKDKIKIEKNDE